MAEAQRLLSREMDIDRPCAARIYDAFLGGSHNFGVERRFAERLELALPGVTGVFRDNRAFLRRAVEYLLARGVRQFLDLGSGIPTIGHVHEVARRRTGRFRVLSNTSAAVTPVPGERMTETAIHTSDVLIEVNGMRHPLHPPGVVIGRGSDDDETVNGTNTRRKWCELVLKREEALRKRAEGRRIHSRTKSMII